jgi:hypothetical protein
VSTALYPGLYFIITLQQKAKLHEQNKSKIMLHKPAHQQLYYLWPLHTYTNTISLILTPRYFYMNTKRDSVRIGVGWGGVETVNTGGVNQMLGGGKEDDG